MANFVKNKIVTGIVVTITLILAGVAVFTAMRLYQLRESISPTSPQSQPFAWDCSKYTFSVGQNGTVTAANQSTRNEPSQQAKVLLNGQLAATLSVPALNQGQSITIGSVTLPSGTVNWEVQGTLDCKNSGVLNAPKVCQGLTFSLTQNSPTVTVTTNPSHTPTQSPTPTGGNTGTPTPTNPASTNTPTPTTENGSSPTPTTVSQVTPTTIAQATPTTIAQNTPTTRQVAQITQSGGVGGAGNEILPDAGYDIPTVLGIALGILLIVGAFMLAI